MLPADIEAVFPVSRALTKATERMESAMQYTLAEYTESSSYQQDLASLAKVWGEPGVLGVAGMFIFLSYITIPKLIAVQPPLGYARAYTMKMGLNSEREKRFLQRTVGLSTESGWQGGICNMRVRQIIVKLGQNHHQFLGMQQEYMEYFAGIIALSAPRVHTIYSHPIDSDIKTGYWRYMQYMLSLLGVQLKGEAFTESQCQAFIDEHTEPTVPGSILLSSLCEIYPEYVEKSLPVLFPKTFLAVQSLLEEHDV